MPSDVTREEFEGRVGVLEREVEGEKLVTRHILEQTRLNSDDLAAIRTRLDGVDRKVDGLDQKIGGVAQDVVGVRQDLTSLRGTVTGLVTALPTMIADVMREVLRERGGKV